MLQLNKNVLKELRICSKTDHFCECVEKEADNGKKRKKTIKLGNASQRN